MRRALGGHRLSSSGRVPTEEPLSMLDMDGAAIGADSLLRNEGRWSDCVSVIRPRVESVFRVLIVWQSSYTDGQYKYCPLLVDATRGFSQ